MMTHPSSKTRGLTKWSSRNGSGFLFRLRDVCWPWEQTGGQKIHRRNESPKVLHRLQAIRLIRLAPNGRPLIGFFSKISADLNALLQKLDLLPLFARPPQWAM
ncbi:hypothetical protein MAMT_02112 [Methylacidimicrobium tartarophylax]|uniref:Uncharacterized protein n=1 Tax=Methylacidimicrobium tartarophylax TaxID=1041768 RepID=A0A5E6MFR9_9BACT|nr:hypothetical protein MAMT_02112 [Methylacidimicrobium tartarophylax]